MALSVELLYVYELLLRGFPIGLSRCAYKGRNLFDTEYRSVNRSISNNNNKMAAPVGVGNWEQVLRCLLEKARKTSDLQVFQNCTNDNERIEHLQKKLDLKYVY